MRQSAGVRTKPKSKRPRESHRRQKTARLGGKRSFTQTRHAWTILYATKKSIWNRYRTTNEKTRNDRRNSDQKNMEKTQNFRWRIGLQARQKITTSEKRIGPEK